MGRCISSRSSSLSFLKLKTVKTTQNLSQQYSFFCGDLTASSSIFPRRVSDIFEKTGEKDFFGGSRGRSQEGLQRDTQNPYSRNGSFLEFDKD